METGGWVSRALWEARWAGGGDWMKSRGSGIGSGMSSRVDSGALAQDGNLGRRRWVRGMRASLCLGCLWTSYVEKSRRPLDLQAGGQQ